MHVCGSHGCGGLDGGRDGVGAWKACGTKPGGWSYVGRCRSMTACVLVRDYKPPLGEISHVLFLAVPLTFLGIFYNFNKLNKLQMG